MNFGKNNGFTKLTMNGKYPEIRTFATELQRFRYELNNRKQSVIRSIASTLTTIY
jgi:transcriptional accessory protein Tex/SPT6